MVFFLFFYSNFLSLNKQQTAQEYQWLCQGNMNWTDTDFLDIKHVFFFIRQLTVLFFLGGMIQRYLYVKSYTVWKKDFDTGQELINKVCFFSVVFQYLFFFFLIFCTNSVVFVSSVFRENEEDLTKLESLTQHVSGEFIPNFTNPKIMSQRFIIDICNNIDAFEMTSFFIYSGFGSSFVDNIRANYPTDILGVISFDVYIWSFVKKKTKK